VVLVAAGVRAEAGAGAVRVIGVVHWPNAWRAALMRTRTETEVAAQTCVYISSD
jgi:hypothetical protein